MLVCIECVLYGTAAAVMYERAARCGAERASGAVVRRRCLGAALTCLRLAQPEHAFLARPAAQGKQLQVWHSNKNLHDRFLAISRALSSN